MPVVKANNVIESPFALYKDTEPPHPSTLPPSPTEKRRERSVSVIGDGASQYTYFEKQTRRRAQPSKFPAEHLGQATIVLTIMGIMMVVMQAVIVARQYWGYKAGVGFGCGVMYVLSSALTWFAKDVKNRTSVVGCIAISCLSWLFTWPVIGISTTSLIVGSEAEKGIAANTMMLLCAVFGLLASSAQLHYARKSLLKASASWAL